MKLSPEFIKKAIYSAESGLPVTWQAIHVRALASNPHTRAMSRNIADMRQSFFR